MHRKAVMLIAVIAGLALPAASFADPRGKAVKAQRQQQKEERKTFHQTQQEENKSFRESVKNMTGEEKQPAIQEHRQEQVQERKSFHDTQVEENKAFIDELKAGNQTVNQTAETQE